jgi:hypothetical protein
VQERDALGAIPAGRPRRVAHEHVELAGLQGGEAGVRIDVDELDLRRVAEHRSGDHPAEVGVEADVLTLLIQNVKAREIVSDTATHDVGSDHRVEDRVARWRRGDHARCSGAVSAP